MSEKFEIEQLVGKMLEQDLTSDHESVIFLRGGESHVQITSSSGAFPLSEHLMATIIVDAKMVVDRLSPAFFDSVVTEIAEKIRSFPMFSTEGQLVVHRTWVIPSIEYRTDAPTKTPQLLVRVGHVVLSISSKWESK